MQPVDFYIRLMADRGVKKKYRKVEDTPTNVKSRRMGLVDWIIALTKPQFVWLLTDSL